MNYKLFTDFIIPIIQPMKNQNINEDIRVIDNIKISLD